MYAHLSHKHKGRWDIKADEGGITDIEFITQYLVLRYAAQEPGLTGWSDNVRILALLARHNKITPQEADALTQAYVTLRDELHHLALQEQAGHVAPGAFMHERQIVQESWRRWLQTTPAGA